MADTVYSAFDTTPTGAVAAIKAVILTSAQWSNPAGDRVVATTTRGAEICVNLADAAASATSLQFGVYRTAALVDKITRYLAWRNSGGATSDPLHVIVSAGKDHLFISIEGPRAGEANAVSVSGSYRTPFFVCDLVPYHASDTEVAVVCGGNSVATASSAIHVLVHVSRNQGDSASWAPGVLETLQPPRTEAATLYRAGGQSASTADSMKYLRPYVFFDDVDGIRGRLSSLFYGGLLQVGTVAGDAPLPLWSKFTFGGATYILVPSVKADWSGSVQVSGLGVADNDTGPPLVAVPWA